MVNEIEKMAELRSIKNWCVTVLEFIKKKEVDESSVFIWNRMIENVNNIYSEKKLTSMRMMKRDVADFFHDFNPKEKEEITNLLGEHKDFYLEEERRKVSIIIDRKKIDNDMEFQFLNQYIDYLLDEKKPEQIEVINALLSEYEKDVNV